MMKILISPEAGKKLDELPTKDRGIVIKTILRTLDKGSLSRFKNLPSTDLYFLIIGKYAPIFAKEKGGMLIIIDILTKKELISEIRKARFGL